MLSRRSIHKNCAIYMFLEVPISSLSLKGRVPVSLLRVVGMKLFSQNVSSSDLKTFFNCSNLAVSLKCCKSKICDGKLDEKVFRTGAQTSNLNWSKDSRFG